MAAAGRCGHEIAEDPIVANIGAEAEVRELRPEVAAVAVAWHLVFVEHVQQTAGDERAVIVFGVGITGIAGTVVHTVMAPHQPRSHLGVAAESYPGLGTDAAEAVSVLADPKTVGEHRVEQRLEPGERGQEESTVEADRLIPLGPQEVSRAKGQVGAPLPTQPIHLEQVDTCGERGAAATLVVLPVGEAQAEQRPRVWLFPGGDLQHVPVVLALEPEVDRLHETQLVDPAEVVLETRNVQRLSGRLGDAAP